MTRSPVATSATVAGTDFTKKTLEIMVNIAEMDVTAAATMSGTEQTPDEKGSSEVVKCDSCGGTGHRTIGHVAALRRRLGLSQRELASRLGVGKRTVTSWESGKHQPSAPTLELLERMVTEAGRGRD